MIASIGLETIERGNLSEYIDTRTRIWAVMPIESTKVIQREHLMMAPELMEKYYQLLNEQELNYDIFKTQIVPKYFGQLLNDPEAVYDLNEIALAAAEPQMEIALLGESPFEFLCVRSVILGLLQGAGRLTDYITDCFDKKPDDYSDYFFKAPKALQDKICQFI